MCAQETSNTIRAMRDAPFFGDVCLLGLGVTGRAVVDFFLRYPQYLNTLTIYAGANEKENRAYLESLPSSLIVRSGEEVVSGSFNVTVVSPGIPPHSLLYRSALQASNEVISEPELAWRIAPHKWIAITGTNGKTTVTELVTALLEAAGKTAWASGNIGTPCIDIVARRNPEDWLIAELSSYQLHSTLHFAPDIALLLNITPDHLSWHGSHESYVADKERILANLASDAPAIIDVSGPETSAAAKTRANQGGRVIGIGTARNFAATGLKQAQECAYVEPATHTLVLEHERGVYRLLHADELHIKGPHNLSNALAAAAAVAEVGATAEELNSGLASFFPLPHRFEPCGEVNGVLFINDSKATNSDAAIKALSSFADDAQSGRIVALFGGVDKGTDLDELALACESPCHDVVCYGEAGMRFNAALEPKVPSLYVKTFAEAFYAAVNLARPGDTVLLSPACASFDEFDSFEARGDEFKRLVSLLGGECS